VYLLLFKMTVISESMPDTGCLWCAVIRQENGVKKPKYTEFSWTNNCVTTFHDVPPLAKLMQVLAPDEPDAAAHSCDLTC